MVLWAADLLLGEVGHGIRDYVATQGGRTVTVGDLQGKELIELIVIVHRLHAPAEEDIVGQHSLHFRPVEVFGDLVHVRLLGVTYDGAGNEVATGAVDIQLQQGKERVFLGVFFSGHLTGCRRLLAFSVNLRHERIGL